MAVRPIDANVAMKKIREYMEGFPNANTRLAACRAILSMLGDKSQIPTLTPQNEWISVAERLPRENTPILIYENSDTAVAIFMGKEFLEYSDTGYPVLIRRPTHWMLLPEPPKEV